MSRLLTAEIIAAGTELLTPYRIDTNSLFLTARLNELGIEIRAKSVVGDSRADFAAILSAALGRSDIVITTGGLGPTDDDVTRDVLADVLQRPLEEHVEIVDAIRERFARRGATMPEINRKQGLVPRGGLALPNPRGSAPGLYLESNGRVVIALPGPPRELEPMFETEVAPRLAPLSGGRRLRRRVIKITGRSESQVEEVVQPIYATWTTEAVPIETTILASPGQIELHLSAAGADVAAVDARLDDSVGRLAAALGSVIFSTDGRSLEAVVGDLLRGHDWRVAVAESCTGGLLTGRLTDVPGSSAWVIGGVIAYDNAVKISELGVAADLIAAHGAVSEPVARAMAEGVKQRFGADIGVSVTGIAGPGGGSTDKPVGTVVIAVSGATTRVTTHRFPGERETVRRFATAAALEMLRRAMEN